MSNYRVVEVSSKYIIEVKKVIRKWYWFGNEVIEWRDCNIKGGVYGEKYKEDDTTFWFRLGKGQVIPRLATFSYPRQAREKIKEFEAEAILQSNIH